jgi:hypothetical protein
MTLGSLNELLILETNSIKVTIGVTGVTIAVAISITITICMISSTTDLESKCDKNNRPLARIPMTGMPTLDKSKSESRTEGNMTSAIQLPYESSVTDSGLLENTSVRLESTYSVFFPILVAMPSTYFMSLGDLSINEK